MLLLLLWCFLLRVCADLILIRPILDPTALSSLSQAPKLCQPSAGGCLFREAATPAKLKAEAAVHCQSAKQLELVLLYYCTPGLSPDNSPAPCPCSARRAHARCTPAAARRPVRSRNSQSTAASISKTKGKNGSAAQWPGGACSERIGSLAAVAVPASPSLRHGHGLPATAVNSLPALQL